MIHHFRQFKVVFDKIRKLQTQQYTRETFFLRNQSYTKQSFHTQELNDLIPILLKMLDSLYSLPIQTNWQQSHIIILLTQFLKLAENLTLSAWNSKNPKKYLQLWNTFQKRHEKSLLNTYYQLSECLLHWSRETPQEWLGSKDLWQDYVFFILMNDACVKKYFISETVIAYQKEQIASHYLHHAQAIFQVHLEELTRRLFIWIACWTEESYFLPTLKAEQKQPTQSHLSELQQWKISLLESEDWRKFAKDYLALLDSKF